MFVRHCGLYSVFLSQTFCTTGLVSSKLVAQIYEEEIHFGKLLLKQIV